MCNNIKMSLVEAENILGGIFYSYYGPGYTWRHVIEGMCQKHPRGESGLSMKPEEYRKEYEAAFRIKQEMSNPYSPYGKRK